MKYINLFDCTTSLYYPDVQQSFSVYLNDELTLTNDEYKRLTLTGKFTEKDIYGSDRTTHINIFFKDIKYLDFGDTSDIRSSECSHNNRYKPVLKTNNYTIHHITFINEEYTKSFLNYNYKKQKIQINGHIYINKPLIFKNKSGCICFSGRVEFNTIGVKQKIFFSKFEIMNATKMKNYNVYELTLFNNLQFFVYNPYILKCCKKYFQNIEIDDNPIQS